MSSWTKRLVEWRGNGDDGSDGDGDGDSGGDNDDDDGVLLTIPFVSAPWLVVLAYGIRAMATVQRTDRATHHSPLAGRLIGFM